MGKTKKLLMEMEDDAYYFTLGEWVKKYGNKNVNIFHRINELYTKKKSQEVASKT